MKLFPQHAELLRLRADVEELKSKLRHREEDLKNLRDQLEGREETKQEAALRVECARLNAELTETRLQNELLGADQPPHVLAFLNQDSDLMMKEFPRNADGIKALQKERDKAVAERDEARLALSRFGPVSAKRKRKK